LGAVINFGVRKKRFNHAANIRTLTDIKKEIRKKLWQENQKI
jgi:hypothetical protein